VPHYGRVRASRRPAAIGKQIPTKHTGYFELVEALDASACSVCRRAEDAVEQAITSLLYESVTDSGIRKQLEQSFGFCWTHAWQLARRNDVLGTSMLHRDLVQRFTVETTSPRRTRQRTKATPRRPCMLCDTRDDAARDTLSELLTHLKDPDLRRRFEASDGLCHRHFDDALGRGAAQTELPSLQAGCLARLVHQLDELIRKHDYRFVHEADQGEGNAWLRAVASVSGLNIEQLPAPRSRELPPQKKRGPTQAPAP